MNPINTWLRSQGDLGHMNMFAKINCMHIKHHLCCKSKTQHAKLQECFTINYEVHGTIYISMHETQITKCMHSFHNVGSCNHILRFIGKYKTRHKYKSFVTHCWSFHDLIEYSSTNIEVYIINYKSEA